MSVVPPWISSFDPDAVGDAPAADDERHGGVGVYAQFARISTADEAYRRFARLKPHRQAEHIAEWRRGQQFVQRARGGP